MKKIKEVSKKYLRNICMCVIKAILIVLYFFISNFLYTNVDIKTLETGIQIVAMVFLFKAIYTFEKAYKKDDGSLAIKGIEFLSFSFYMVTARYIQIRFNIENYSIFVTCVYAIYFVLKAMVIYTKGINKLSQNLSDVRQIVKKDIPIKKEARKRLNNIIEN